MEKRWSLIKMSRRFGSEYGQAFVFPRNDAFENELMKLDKMGQLRVQEVYDYDPPSVKIFHLTDSELDDLGTFEDVRQKYQLDECALDASNAHWEVASSTLND